MNILTLKKRLLEEKKKKEEAINSTDNRDTSGIKHAMDGKEPIEISPPVLKIDQSILHHRFGSVPSCYFQQNVLFEDESNDIIRFIDLPQNSARWVALRRRRLQQWGGVPMPEGLQDHEPLPPIFSALSDKLVAAGVFPTDKKPNHFLINEYLTGQGILPHTDGPLYFPCVATISLGGPCVMKYHIRQRDKVVGHSDVISELILPPLSIVITTGELYLDYMHSIPETDMDVIGETGSPVLNASLCGLEVGDEVYRGPRRISITMRYVPLP